MAIARNQRLLPMKPGLVYTARPTNSRERVRASRGTGHEKSRRRPEASMASKEARPAEPAGDCRVDPVRQRAVQPGGVDGRDGRRVPLRDDRHRRTGGRESGGLHRGVAPAHP